MRSVLLLLTFPLIVQAHESSRNSAGKKLKWPQNSVPVVINTNTSDLTNATTRNLIQSTISQWNSVSKVQITPATASNNEIRFQSDFSRYGSSVIGVTEVSSNSSGSITSAIIRLNDNYEFKSAPGYYSGRQIYLNDVVTHELGHFLGMAHSEILNSTMFYSNFPGQSSLAYDDKSGIRSKYDSGFGRIYGHVRGGNSIGVLGAQVQLISRKTGDVVGAITDENGYFDIRGLDVNDTFYLYTAPVKKIDSLSGVYSNVQTEFCPASYVGSFFTACGDDNDGVAQGITLTSSRKSVDVGTVTINCELRTSTAYSAEKLQASFSTLNVYDYAEDQKYEKAVVGYFQNPSDSSWSEDDKLEVDLRSFNRLSGNQKYLKVNLIAYPFGNQLQYQMDFERNGVALTTYSQQLNYSTVTQTYNNDMEALIPLSGTASQNIYLVKLRAQKLTSSFIAQTFPSPDIFSSDQHLPYLMVISLWENKSGAIVPMLDSGSTLSDNEVCMDAPFTFKVQAAKVADDTKDSGSAAAAGASCGTTGSGDDGQGPGPHLFIGFALSFFLATVLKTSKKFLS